MQLGYLSEGKRILLIKTVPTRLEYMTLRKGKLCFTEFYHMGGLKLNDAKIQKELWETAGSPGGMVNHFTI